MNASGPSSDTASSLAATAGQIRQDVVRMIYEAGGGDVGGNLSVIDLLTALVFHEMRLDPDHPDWPDRDRLVLSKGHAAPALYAALARRGLLDPERLSTLREIGSPLQGRVDHRTLPAVEASTGAPGQGLGLAVGMALDARLAARPSRVYAVLGDGECRAGATWEALLAGGQHALDRFVVVVDRNGQEAPTGTGGTPDIEPLTDKFRAFRYHTLEVPGHDFAAILEAFAGARQARGEPTAIVARTVFGKGVSFIENRPEWRERSLNREETERALAELGGRL